MSKVSVITGGAGGMGLATAKVVGRDHTLVLCDVRQDRLDEAAKALDSLGITFQAVNCDVTDRKVVDGLLETASGLGTVTSVIHTAGVSPSMGSAEYVMRTNAIGTLNVNESFYASAGEGAAIVNVASMAAHMLPENMVPTKQFPQALTDEAAFMTDMLAACSTVPEEMQSGIAYAVSKSFVRWYCSHSVNGSTARASASSPSPRAPSTPRWVSWRSRCRRRCDGRRRRGPTLGQAGGDGRPAGVLCQRQGRLPHRHRHPERRRRHRLDDGASQAVRGQLAVRAGPPRW